jgi:uncharacterized Zn finger protein
MSYFQFKPYVPVAERRRNAQKQLAQLAKKGKIIKPVTLEGRTIAHSFWGKAWCDNLESYSDFENRLPRGRTYVRNGSVVHLDVRAGQIEAMVSGSEMYKVNIGIVPAAREKWSALCRECAGGIGSLVELLQGRFSDRVMDVITRKGTGLFPTPSEIKMTCSCPDWATLCKHVAAVLYGVGARLDESPELLFVLRSVDQEELITQAAAVTDLTAKTETGGLELSESDMGAVFGIEMDTQTQPVAPSKSAGPAKAAKVSGKKQPKSSPKTTEKSNAQRKKEAKPKPAGKAAVKAAKPKPAKAKKKPVKSIS